jgi:hypothetical protein
VVIGEAAIASNLMAFATKLGVVMRVTTKAAAIGVSQGIFFKRRIAIQV